MNTRLVLGCLVVVGIVAIGTAWTRYGLYKQSPSKELATSTLKQLTPQDVGTRNASQGMLSLLTFTVPRKESEVRAVDGVNLMWKLTDSKLLQEYPNEDTYIYIQLISENDEVVGVIAEPHLRETSAFWNIKSRLIQEFYRITPGAKYRARATLAYQPKEFTCDPAVKGECSPVYSTTNQALIDKAKRYQSESDWFTISLDGYIHPTVTIDQNSLTVSSSNPSIRGTATSNVTAIKVNVVRESKYLVQTTVPVLNGMWSFTPSLPNGTYSIELWDTTSAAYFPSATFTVTK